ncbi:phage tail assembly chaperone [Flavobacteriaceae bacterium]|nr:phage tail assembly chaperone [Flavobacteriaceae bacterium]
MVSEGAVVDIPADTLEQEQIAKAWSDLTLNRNELLQASDWTQVSDAPVDHAAWAVYRQELRDLPANTEDPRNPVWPTRPN